MFIPRIAFPLLAAVLAMPAFAQVVDDAVRLAAGGVSEDVMVTWAERQSGHEISAADIVALKDAKVSDRVIIALIRRSADTEMAAVEPEPVQRREVVRQQPAPLREREVIRYVDSPTTTYETTPGVQLAASYYYPRYSRYYYSYPRYSYPRYYSSPRYYNYSPRYYYPRYSRGYYGRSYYPRYYGGGYYHRGYRSGFRGGFSINF